MNHEAHRPTRTAVLISVLLLSACDSRSLRWTEDVVLPDGQKMVLTRYAEFKGPHELGRPSTLSNYWFEFVNPDTRQTVRWTGRRDLQPISVAMIDGLPQLLMSPNFDGMYRYKCPDPPYIAFQHDGKRWLRVSLNDMKQKVLPPNLMRSQGDVKRALGRYQRHLNAEELLHLLPYEWRHKMIDVSAVSEQTFGFRCNAPFDYRLREP